MAISLYLSGGAANTSPTLSLGGAISSMLVTRSLFGVQVRQLWRTGATLYRMVYAKTDADVAALTAWIEETPSLSTTIAIGWAAAGVAETEPAIAVQTHAVHPSDGDLRHQLPRDSGLRSLRVRRELGTRRDRSRLSGGRLNVFRTFMLRAAVGAKAVAICSALGYPEKGMFSAKVADGPEPSNGPDNRPAVAYVASGIVDDTCPLLGTAVELFAACQARTAAREELLTVTLADCTAVVNALDRGNIEPHGLIRAVIREAKGQVATPAWVAGYEQSPGVPGYGPHQGVTHLGVKYLNLLRENTSEPPARGWRVLR